MVIFAWFESSLRAELQHIITVSDNTVTVNWDRSFTSNSELLRWHWHCDSCSDEASGISVLPGCSLCVGAGIGWVGTRACGGRWTCPARGPGGSPTETRPWSGSAGTACMPCRRSTCTAGTASLQRAWRLVHQCCRIHRCCRGVECCLVISVHQCSKIHQCCRGGVLPGGLFTSAVEVWSVAWRLVHQCCRGVECCLVVGSPGL